MDEELPWVPIRGFEGYYINENGQVLNRRRNPPSLVPVEMLSGELVVVRMIADGAFHPHPVALDLLMVDHFLEPPARSHLYELVHIDDNPMNCRVDNYGWRRKWIPLNMREQ